ncbi:MAG: N-acetylmuramoyl-L-alanine amidase [Oscillospiraceae bacterium]|nr:N-acetylmuramoyl-L-alanine amidase [Oscillospiraceae bacterium]
MKRKFTRYGVLVLLLLIGMVFMTACGQTWSWLWTREGGTPIDTNRLILGGGAPESETDVSLEGAVEYTGEAHSGTDIYYVGKAGSPNRSRIIVIDAGHQLKGSSALEPNGPDSEIMKAEVSWGATGVYTGQTEYDLNLAVALLLRDELIRRGYSVVMIRETNNVQISNMERAGIANKYEAAAYIRIHANSWTDDSMRGAMTISQSASNPYPTCAIHYERSHRLSCFVLDEFCEQTGIEKLNKREMDDMTGTNWSRVPTTIVEMGFLSNKSDDTLMATDYFRREAAMGIANGLDAYFQWLETQLPEWETQAQKPAETPTEESTHGATEAEPDVETDEPADTVDTAAVTEPSSDTAAEEATVAPEESEVTPDDTDASDAVSDAPAESLPDDPASAP